MVQEMRVRAKFKGSSQVQCRNQKVLPGIDRVQAEDKTLITDVHASSKRDLTFQSIFLFIKTSDINFLFICQNNCLEEDEV